MKVTEQELLDFGLRSGDRLSDETLEALKKSAGGSNVKATAADLIGKRAMSKSSLEKKLKEKGATEYEARYASEWLEAIGAIDDAAYAAALVRHCGDKGYGPAKTKEKLYEKGVPRELWEDALEELPGNEEQIEKFLTAKLRGEYPDEKEKKRLIDALLRRGFPWGDIKRVFGRLLDTYFED